MEPVIKVTAIAIILLTMSPITATAKKINVLNGYPQEVTTIINDPKNEVVMIKSFNVDSSGCDVREQMMRIDKITMDSDDRYPEKMTFRDMQNMRISMPTNFSSLDNASRSWTDSMFSENEWVNVQYLLCGSGGFPQMTSISKHSKRFPKVGVTIGSK
ncbi:hypothetical protein KBV23_004837 [Escherichia coli]|uniref:hypothetical protein n=1 Tax=Escherichia coli TaxID=562 RepID=UPI000DDA189D|nr:hypothetical protein [Escherichia coli]EEV8081742.1 hypothetical protein [Escherichia coli]EEZ7155742.1 hypothetical protein [Escherichia coli]EFA5453082.1 hypothetical protein [Escherichia coli]EFH4723950.1 hypothetical protein [Escherichia coli]EFN4969913.1 hypothetical protein [Escherichia coli]